MLRKNIQTGIRVLILITYYVNVILMLKAKQFQMTLLISPRPTQNTNAFSIADEMGNKCCYSYSGLKLPFHKVLFCEVSQKEYCFARTCFASRPAVEHRQWFLHLSHWHPLQPGSFLPEGRIGGTIFHFRPHRQQPPNYHF